MRRITCTWFNPPCSKSVVTRIEQKFLRPIDRHFRVGSKLHKIFNRSRVRISYSCMPNMGTIIKRHNTLVCRAGHESDNRPRRCNCREPYHCPVNRECLTSSIVYKAIVEAGSTSAPKNYVGSTETPF